MLGSLQEGFETNIKLKPMFKAIQQRQLIDEDSPQGETAGGNKPFGRYLPIPTKDALEVLVEVLHCYRAQFVEDASHILAAAHISFRRLASMRCHQPPPSQHTQ